jgi:hypothetical protein
VRSEVQVLLDPPLPLASSSRRRQAAKTFGALAQLGERLICIQEVIGSIPIGSTITLRVLAPPIVLLVARLWRDRLHQSFLRPSLKNSD